MGAVSDIDKADQYAKKPPLFKKLFNAGSVEEEALNAFMAKKKAQDMRDELKNIIVFSRGPNAWNELLKTEADIRVKRQQAIYAQQELRRKVVEIIAVVVVLGVAIGAIGLVIYAAGVRRGLW